jgi:hypothetical protein
MISWLPIKPFWDGLRIAGQTFLNSTAPQTNVRFANQPFSTTSVLTAAILKYATGAGITAAAGTRLALQLLSGHYLPASHSNQTRKNPSPLAFLVTTSLY